MALSLVGAGASDTPKQRLPHSAPLLPPPASRYRTRGPRVSEGPSEYAAVAPPGRRSTMAGFYVQVQNVLVTNSNTVSVIGGE